MVKKESDLSPAEREFLEGETFKQKRKAEKIANKQAFDEAVKTDTLTEFKGDVPKDSDVTYGRMWKRINDLAETTIKLKAEKEFEINNRISDIEIKKNTIGDLTPDIVGRYTTPLTANLEANINKILTEKNSIFETKQDKVYKPNTRMHQGWTYGSGVKGDQSVAKVLGIIASDTADFSDEVDILAGNKKGTVDISDFFSKNFKRNTDVIKKLNDVTFSSNIATQYVSKIISQVNNHNTGKETTDMILSAIGKNLDSIQGTIHLADDVKDYLSFTLLEAQEIVKGLGGDLTQKALFDYQQSILSTRKAGILTDAYPIISAIKDPNNKNITLAILSDYYGYPSEEPVLTADNKINKKYYGDNFSKVTKGKVFRSQLLDAEIQYINELILNASNTNTVINMDTVQSNLEKITKNKPVPLNDSQVNRAISAMDTKVKVALTDAKKLKALGHTLRFKLGIASGLRNDELGNIRLEDLDLENNKIFVTDGKGGKPREAFILDKKEIGLIDTYNEYIRLSRLTDRKGYLFPSKSAKSGKASKSAFDIFLKDIANETDIPEKDLTPHRLRHYRVTKVAREGGIDIARKVAGHVHSDTTSIYVHDVDISLAGKKDIDLERYSIDQDGLYIDPKKVSNNQIDSLKIIKTELVKERKELVENASDYVVSPEKIAKQRRKTDMFKFSTWSNLDLQIKNVDLSQKPVDTRTVKGVKTFLNTPNAINIKKTGVGIESGPFVQTVVNGVDNSKRLSQINFDLFAPTTDDTITVFADPDNYGSKIGLNNEIVTVDLTSNFTEGPFKTVDDIPVGTGTVFVPEAVEIKKPPKINRQRGRFKKLSKEQKRSIFNLLDSTKKHSYFGLLIPSLLSKVAEVLPFGKQIKGGITSSKVLGKKLLEPGAEVGIEWLMYDPAQGEKLLQDYERNEEGKITGGRTISFLDNIKFEGFELEQTTDPKKAEANLDKLTGEQFVEFAGTDVNKKLGVEETSFDPNRPLDKTIYGASGEQTLLNPDQEEFRGQIEESTKPLVASAYSDAQANYEKNLLNKISKKDSTFNVDDAAPVEDKDVLNPNMTIDQLMLDKRLREKKLEENLEATLAEDRLAEIQEARLNKVDESIDAIKNTEVDIDKELGPEVRTNNQMSNLGLMSQPQGEENATIR